MEPQFAAENTSLNWPNNGSVIYTIATNFTIEPPFRRKSESMLPLIITICSVLGILIFISCMYCLREYWKSSTNYLPSRLWCRYISLYCLGIFNNIFYCIGSLRSKTPDNSRTRTRRAKSRTPEFEFDVSSREASPDKVWIPHSLLTNLYQSYGNPNDVCYINESRSIGDSSVNSSYEGSENEAYGRSAYNEHVVPVEIHQHTFPPSRNCSSTYTDSGVGNAIPRCRQSTPLNFRLPTDGMNLEEVIVELPSSRNSRKKETSV